MSDIILAQPRPVGLIGRIELALQVRRERRMLLGLGDCMLKDLGLDRGSAYAEGTRAFWDVPVDPARR